MVTDDFIRRRFMPWRCLHSGPLDRQNIDHWQAGKGIPWAELQARNTPLLQRLAEVYGAVAVAACTGDQVVGLLRFYPKELYGMTEAGMLCLQQAYPAGPKDGLAGEDFPPLDRLIEKTLLVHCMMTGCPAQKENPYQRQGIGSRMAQKLVTWAGENGWKAVEATAYEDLEILYAVTGQAGKTFWEKLGFKRIAAGVEEALLQDGDFTRAVRAEANVKGMSAEQAASKYTLVRQT
jgi:hypothetical protein